MDIDVAHGIEYLVSGNHRFSVGLRHTRPSASIVTEQRAVCIDLARGVVDIDVAAADGERFLASAFDRDMFVLLVIRGDDDLALTRFTPSGASQTTSLFPALSTPMFPCALVIDAARTGILLNTVDGIWFTSRQTRSLHPEPWPEAELQMAEIGEWFNPSMVDLVTPPGPGGPCCGLGYSPAPGNVGGGEMVGPDGEGWTARPQAVRHPREFDPDRTSEVHLTDIRCVMIGEVPAIVYGGEGAVEARDLRTGEPVLSRVLGSGPGTGDDGRVYSVDVLNGLMALLLRHTIEIRYVDSFGVIDRIGVRPQKPVGPGQEQHRDLTRGSVRLLETPTGPLVAWLEDGAVRAASVSAPAPTRATATSVPRRSMSLDVSADGSVVAWIDGEGVPWVVSAGPSPDPCRIDARLATDRVFAGSARDAHPVLLTGRSDHDERWLLLGQDYTEQTAASGSSDGVTDAAFVGGLWMLSLDSGEVRAIPGDAGPRGNALWRSEGSSPLLVTAGWTVVEAAWQDQSGVVTVRAGANDSVLGHLRTWPVDGIAAVWQRSFFGRDLFVVCSTSRPRDVLIMRLDTCPDGGFEEVVRIRQCAPRGVALAASPVHAVAALLFDDRCDLVDAANGRILTSARLDPDAAVLIEGPWGTRFLAGESVRALPLYDDWGLPLTEETARLPLRAGSVGRGDLPWRYEDHPRPAVEPLDWAGSPQADAVFGDSGRWTRSIPTLWHLFGVAGSDIHPPRAPHPNEGWDHQAAFDYWNPLLHLLLGPLGWADPSMGASRWLAADMPVTCPATRLLREWWGDDVRALEARSPAGLAAADIEDSLDLQPLAPRRSRDSFIKMSPGSWIPLVQGGLDPLHLGPHAVAVMLGRPGYHEQPNYLGEPRLAFDTNRRAGALLIPTYAGWYRQLHEAAAHLESEHGPDFSIDVTVRPMGWLGTYRRSPASGRWHASTERTHLMGVPEEGEHDG